VVGITQYFWWHLRNPSDAHILDTVYTFTREMPTKNLTENFGQFIYPSVVSVASPAAALLLHLIPLLALPNVGPDCDPCGGFQEVIVQNKQKKLTFWFINVSLD